MDRPGGSLSLLSICCFCVRNNLLHDRVHPSRDMPALLCQQHPVPVIQCASKLVDYLAVDTIFANITQCLEDNPSLMSCADERLGRRVPELIDLPSNFFGRRRAICHVGRRGRHLS